MQEMKIIILLSYLFKICSSEIIVETNNGPIRSTVSLSDDVEAFLGIPYAEPPIGDLRFAKSVPKQHWTEVYNASKIPSACMQVARDFVYYFSPDISNMSEDCLYLNMWVPRAKSERGLRPVLIYIHHGAFYFGSSNQREFDGSHLASKGDMVVVTFNYRLGSLGFFVAYTEEANGNMGMYDQVLAINWVKDNAKYFGGDPENIVLMGTSAGAASVSGHMISPLTQNLFKRAIITSGSLLTPMYMNEKALFRNCDGVARIVGCANYTVTLRDNPRAVVKCLKERPAEMLIEAESRINKGKANVFYPRANDEFLPKDAASLLREGKFRKDVDVMFGNAKEEGDIMLAIAVPAYFGKYGELPLNPISAVKASTIGRSAGLAVGIENTAEMIKYYLKRVKNRTTEGYRKMVANIIGDSSILCGTVFLADFFSLKGNTVYYYKLGFKAASTPVAEWMETTHLDDIQYIFGNPYHENFTAEEVELSNRLMARFSAFIRTGNPNVSGQMPWLRYSYQNPLYLYIGQEEESIRMKIMDRCEYWRPRFQAVIDSNVIRFLRNSGMNITSEEYS